MESPPSSIQTLIKKIKKEMFSTVDLYSFVSKSAYETAWLAMVPDIDQKSDQPMFKGCLDWVLNNQKEEGFWGESGDSGADAGAGAGNGPPTIDSLPATLACMVALAKWNVGGNNIKNGTML
ncbi:geranyllinalool synthase [Sarracenia purpurea var. burkii]